MQGLDTYKSNEFHTWSESEIEQFEKCWPVGTKQRLAFDLLICTGQRGSDVAAMARPAPGDNILRSSAKDRDQVSDNRASEFKTVA